MEIPSNFKCPLCFEIMVDDPVQTAAGQTYDRACIEEWVRHCGGRAVTDPLTKKDLGREPVLTSNHALKGSIAQFLAQNQPLRDRLAMYEKVQNQRIRHADKIPSKFVDVLTESIIWDPVIAEDGNTYDRSSISKWIRECKERGEDVVSPISKTPMGERLDEDSGLRRELDEQLSAICREIVQQSGGEEEPVGFPELDKIFAILDDVSDVLHQVLDSWTEPRIVTVGAEKVGKSSLLERLCMMPIFGAQLNAETRRAEHTRMPVEVRIRRSKVQLAPVLQVWDTGVSPAKPLGEPKTIRSVAGNDDMLQAMKHELQVAGATRFVTNRELRLTVTSQSLPPMRLLDLLGLVELPPEDMQASKRLVESYLDAGHGECSIFLAVVQADVPPDTSPALRMLSERNLLASTIGVFTKCDGLLATNELGEETLRNRLLHPQTQEDMLQLEPHGYVATMNKAMGQKQTQDADASPPLTATSGLLRQAKREVSWFKNEGFLDLLAPETRRAGTAALQDRLNTIYTKHVRQTWEPKVRQQLLVQLNKTQEESAKLGLPVCPGNLVRGDYARSFLNEVLPLVTKLLTPVHSGMLAAYVQTTTQEMATRITKIFQVFAGPIPMLEIKGRLAAMRTQLEDTLEAIIPVIRQTWETRVAEALADDSLPFRLQRFPKLIKALNHALSSIGPEVSNSVMDAVKGYLHTTCDPSKSRDLQLEYNQVVMEAVDDSQQAVATTEIVIDAAKCISTMTYLLNEAFKPLEEKNLHTTLQKIITEHQQEQESCHAERVVLQKRISDITIAMLKLQPLRADLCGLESSDHFRVLARERVESGPS